MWWCIALSVTGSSPACPTAFKQWGAEICAACRRQPHLLDDIVVVATTEAAIASHAGQQDGFDRAHSDQGGVHILHAQPLVYAKQNLQRRRCWHARLSEFTAAMHPLFCSHSAAADSCQTAPAVE